MPCQYIHYMHYNMHCMTLQSAAATEFSATTSTPWRAEAAELVRLARHKLGMNQGQFAKTVHRTQTLVSKYERGKVLPPSDVVLHCMHIVHGSVASRMAVSVEAIVERLIHVGNDPAYLPALVAIATLLNVKTSPQAAQQGGEQI